VQIITDFQMISPNITLIKFVITYHFKMINRHCAVNNMNIFLNKHLHASYVSHLGDKFWLIARHHQAFSFKNHSLKNYEYNYEREYVTRIY
jgi:hypothetical protein